MSVNTSVLLSMKAIVDGIYLKRNWGGEYEKVANLIAMLDGVLKMAEKQRPFRS